MFTSVSKRFVIGLTAGGFCLSAGWFLLRAQDKELNSGSIAQGQTSQEARRRSMGCISCHGLTDSPSMHNSTAVQLACIDCHGGNSDVQKPAGADKGSVAYDRVKSQAHPHPRTSLFKKDSAANPVRPYAEWLREDAEYIKFVNPGDLRIAAETCGSCHAKQVRAVHTSMMTHGAMLWQAALYNNGAYPFKNARFGESYTPDGKPQTITMYPAPDQELTRTRGNSAATTAARQMGSVPARQRSSRIRTRRRPTRSTWEIPTGKKHPAHRTTSSAIVDSAR